MLQVGDQCLAYPVSRSERARDEFARELRALLSGIATDGTITDVIEWSALIGRRD